MMSSTAALMGSTEKDFSLILSFLFKADPGSAVAPLSCSSGWASAAEALIYVGDEIHCGVKQMAVECTRQSLEKALSE